ncbi:MAG TPA: UDP-2,3-diacylglucosamine diphosphatase LpxI [Alphaproteobacteria bacterium]|nr:UDP-2,3-diacylglucosamine diphosphatase LpxI [Alphaproteobacteria bacterium]HNS45225.1 UDP-2,3-diacylglucosamine diphosphatase LpxI [Alphaproteobacteria bacterium]
MHSPEKIGIIAGNGDLPDQLAAAIAADGDHPVIVRLGEDFSVGQAGSIINFFKAQNVGTLVMVGGLARPNWLNLKTDLKGLAIVLKVMFRCLGDDALLKVIRGELEREGFEILGVHHFMPDLLCPEGVLGKVVPNESQIEAIREGYKAAKDHGQADRGQSVIVCDGKVLAFEEKSGTNELIRSVAGAHGQKILVKVSKPQQDRDFDLPTIGPATVDAAVASGFHGIAVEALSTLVPNRDDVIRACDVAGLFFVGMGEDDL